MLSIVGLLLASSVSIGFAAEKFLWFTGLAGGQSSYLIMLQATLESGLQCCSEYIHPVVMISPNAESAIEPWLHHLNNSGQVTVIEHQLSFQDRLLSNFFRPEVLPPSQQAAFLRLDIPVVIESVRQMAAQKNNQVRTDYCIYTDSDVFFHKITPWVYPAFISMGPEGMKHTKPENSGVMHMNVTAFRAELPALLDFAVGKKWNFVAGDQGLLLEFYKDRIVALPPELNWKPYWGINENASIVHFHASKFQYCAEEFITLRYTNITDFWKHIEPRCKVYAKHNEAIQNIYKISMAHQMASYSHYLAEFHVLLEKMDNRLDFILGVKNE